MSKSKSKAFAARKAEQSRSRAGAGRTSGRSTVSRRQSGKAEFNVDLHAVKITAAVLGVLVLAGAIAMMIQLSGAYTTEAIITVVLLGFIAGLSAFAAVQTEDFVRFFTRLAR